MDRATDADINIEHRLTEVEQRAKSNTNRLNEHDEIDDWSYKGAGY